MDTQGHSNTSLIATFFLFILSKIARWFDHVTLSDVALGLTVINGCIAILINIPKLVAMTAKYYRKIFGR